MMFTDEVAEDEINVLSEGKISEQSEGLEVGKTYWFDLSEYAGQMGTDNNFNQEYKDSSDKDQKQVDTSLKWVPFTYAGTMEAYSYTEIGKDEGADDIRTSGRSLFIAQYPVKTNVSWDLLYENGLVYGTKKTYNGVQYILRLPSGGNAEEESSSGEIFGWPAENEWDRILDKNGAYIPNCDKKIASWTQDIERGEEENRVVHGFESARYWDYKEFYSSNDVGWRPVLEIPEPDQLITVSLDLNGASLKLSSDSNPDSDIEITGDADYLLCQAVL